MFSLSTDVSEDIRVVSFEDVDRNLSAMAKREDGFLILSRTDQDYVQLARTRTGFRIERRSGSAETHEIAASTTLGERYCDEFDQSDAQRVLRAYFDRLSDAQSGLNWQKLDLQDVFPIYGVAALVVTLGVIAAGAYFVLR